MNDARCLKRLMRSIVVGLCLLQVGQQAALGQVQSHRRVDGVEKPEVFEASFVHKGHVIIEADFHVDGKVLKRALAYDTGTTAPVVISKAFKEELGTANAEIRLGTVEFGELSLVGMDHPAIERINLKTREELPDREVVGILGYPMLAKYISTLDFENKKAYFRPLDSEQRTFLSQAPLSEVEYRSDLNTIWFPVTVNDVEGYAHVDTGYPFTWIEKTAIDPPEVKSFKIGGYDFMPLMQDVEFRPLEQQRNYGIIANRFDLIANIGNSFMGKLLLTIDPQNQKLYFEKAEPIAESH